MDRLRQGLVRLGTFFRQRRLNAEMDEEIRQHLELRIERNLAAGMSADEARYAAQCSFGNIGSLKERARDERGFRWLEDFVRDIGFAARSLRKAPGFTAVVVTSLGLGIGANTALFSLFKTFVLQPLPIEGADRLVDIVHCPVARLQTNKYQPYRRFAGGGDFLEWKAQSHSFDDMSAHTVMFTWSQAGKSNAVLRSDDAAENEAINSARAFANLFPLLGIRPLIGRGFRPADDELTSEPVAMLSYDFWQRRFGGSRDVLGRTVAIGKSSGTVTDYTVVGVMPREFPLFNRVQVWLSQPLRDLGKTDYGYANVGNMAGVIARLKPSVTPAQAQREMEIITQRIRQQHPEVFTTPWAVMLVPVSEVMSHDSRPELLMVFAGAGFVLLIACANVANLLLARGVAREREIAIRAVAGAGRSRLVRQLLAEGLLLAGLGGMAGLAVAAGSIRLFEVFAPTDLYSTNYRSGLPLAGIGLDHRTLLFTGLIALATGMLFGLVPAMRASKPDLNNALKDGANSITNSPRGQWITRLLVVVQVALTVVVVAGAGLLANSLWRLVNVPLGYQPNGVTMLELDLVPKSKFTELTGEATAAGLGTWRATPLRDGFVRDLEQRLRSLPGVQAVGTRDRTVSAPGFHTDRQDFPPRWKNGGKREGLHAENMLRVTPEWMRAMGLRVLQGREFTACDNASSPAVTIVSESFVRRYIPDAKPIGKRIVDSFGQGREIVGVVADSFADFHGPTFAIKQEGDDHPLMYWPLLQPPFSQYEGTKLAFMIQSAVGVRLTGATLRAAVREIDPNQTVNSIQTLDEVGAQLRATPRFYIFVVGGFAGLAMILSAVGVYGVLAFTVARRTHEIGVRMALGASRRDVLELVVSQGMRLALLGVAIGLAGAMVATRALSSLLWGITPTDPLTFGCVTCLLIGVALLACYLPARRATKIEPMAALRCE